jgi:hypothetical protein
MAPTREAPLQEKKKRKNHFPSIEAAKKRYAHGTHARYVLARCRCEPCRDANRQYELDRQAKRRPPFHIKYSPSGKLWVVRHAEKGTIVARYKAKISAQRKAARLNAEHTASSELIPVADVVAHIRTLQHAGVGVKTLGRASTVSQSVINRMLEGDIKRTRRSTAAKIFAVGIDARKTGSRMRADESFVLIDRLVEAGYTRGWIAQSLGYQTAALQIGRSGWLRISKAQEIYDLYAREAKRNRALPAPGAFRIGEVESSLARKYGRDETVAEATAQMRAHGTATRFDTGCRCTGCKKAKERAELAASRRQGLRYIVLPYPLRSQWRVVDSISGALIYKGSNHEHARALQHRLNANDPRAAGKMHVDAAPVQRHLVALVAAGTGPKAIANASGLTSGHIHYILHGRAKTTTAATAGAILAIVPGTLPSGGRIEAAMTWDLLDRLVAVGFAEDWITTLLELPTGAFRERRSSVMLTRARALAVLYTQLREQLPALRALEPHQPEELAA